MKFFTVTILLAIAVGFNAINGTAAEDDKQHASAKNGILNKFQSDYTI